MQFDELRFLCQQAAIDVVANQPPPLTPTLVLPGPHRTRLLSLPGFPDDDELRHRVLVELAHDELTAAGVPCWGFLAEAEADTGDVVVVIYGARRHAPRITAASRDGAMLAAFVEDEPLDPTAMPFLHPLQHAVDAIEGVSDVFAELDPKRSPLPVLEDASDPPTAPPEELRDHG